MRLKHPLITVLCLICLISSSFGLSAPAQDDSDSDSVPANDAVDKLVATSQVTWWFHSALGYHPAILLRIENASGHRINGSTIKFQARFTNLRDGYVNVARDEVRATLEPDRQMKIFLYAPRAFELPIDQNAWPRMECKVMCKVGDNDDVPSQTLLITKLHSLTMSYDDAENTLAKLPDLRFSKQQAVRKSPATAPEKPLLATAGSLSGKGDKPKVTMGQFLTSSTIPGLGDDFYSFEKKFGIPAEFDSNTKDWTWARYQNQSPEFSVIVGSRGQTGKADLIVATVAPNQIKGEQQVTELAKAISGKFRSEQTTAPNHSVRYLPSGRLEFGTLNAKNYRAVYFVPGESPGGSNSFIVVVTRLPGNVLNILRQEAPKAKLLRFLTPVTGVEET